MKGFIEWGIREIHKFMFFLTKTIIFATKNMDFRATLGGGSRRGQGGGEVSMESTGAC